MSVISPLPDLTPAPKSPAARPPDIPDVLSLALYRLSVAQYQAMIKAGILGEDDAVELLEGWLVRIMPRNVPHSRTTRRVRNALEQLAGENCFVESQEPVTTTDSQPEPDVQVARGPVGDYETRLPGPDDLLLVVEVSDSTLRADRGAKLRLYARAAIPVYWIVNLVDRQVEVYTDPTGPADEPTYRNRQDFGQEVMVPIVLDGQEVGRLAVADLLPPAEHGP